MHSVIEQACISISFQCSLVMQAQQQCRAGAANGSNGSQQPPSAWPGRVKVPEVSERMGVKVPASAHAFRMGVPAHQRTT